MRPILINRSLISVSAFMAAAFCTAAWTATSLHPAGAVRSNLLGCSGSTQVGLCVVGETYRAALWSGSASSWIDLTPTNITDSIVNACQGQNQVGSVTVNARNHAAMWSGSAVSFVDLHPASQNQSVAQAVYGGKQGGYMGESGFEQAALWSSTAASVVNLHPSGPWTRSFVTGMSSGTQVGYASSVTSAHAMLWTGTAASAVDLHPSWAGAGSAAYGTWGAYQVGSAQLGNVVHAVMWAGTAASAVDLHPAGYQETRALAVYSNLQVGYFIQAGYEYACAWTGSATSMVNLNASLPAGSRSSRATGVGEDALGVYIVGYGINAATGRTEGFIWRQADPNAFGLSLNKSSVAGQNSVLGSITAAPDPAARVYTTYDNSSLVSTPASVTLPANTASRNFQITTLAVNSTINTTIYARRGTTTRSQPLTLAPLIPTALSFTPVQVTGGQPTSCRVVINGVAGPGGRLIATFDNSVFATTPGTVTVPAGATDVTFPIPTSAVTSLKYVTVTARVSAGEKTGTFRIAP